MSHHKKLPLVGLTTHIETESNRYTQRHPYSAAISKAGGIPILIPPLLPTEQIAGLIENLDALVLTGGEDVNPLLYGAAPHPKLGRTNTARDEFELELCRRWLQSTKPLLGICRGMQLLNIAAGGSLYQDIPSEHPAAMCHRQQSPRHNPAHKVTIEARTLLSRYLGCEDESVFTHHIIVNSLHHQSVREIAHGFRVSAVACDGIIEAIEANDGRPMLGVQWHPEDMVEHSMAEPSAQQLRLFQSLVAVASTLEITHTPLRCADCEAELLREANGYSLALTSTN